MKRAMFDRERFFQALGDETRLRLLNLMGDQELCVCYLVEILGQPQPKISRHLAYLRSAGIVASRREGKWMHYRIVPPADEGAAKVLRNTLTWIGQEKDMQTDRARLVTACCSPAKFVSLLGAGAGSGTATRPPLISCGRLCVSGVRAVVVRWVG